MCTAGSTETPSRDCSRSNGTERAGRPDSRSGLVVGQVGGRKEPMVSEDTGEERAPTRHGRMTGLSWDASYIEGPAPWDVGGPQPAVVRLADEDGFAGAVLDAGCGTGENSLHVASMGLPV